MSFIVNLLRETEKAADVQSFNPSEVQPMLLRESGGSVSWYLKTTLFASIVMTAIVGVTLTGFWISENKYTVHHVSHVVVKKTPAAKPIIKPAVIPAPAKTIQPVQVVYSNVDADRFYQSAIKLMKDDEGIKAIDDLKIAIHINPHFQKAREALAALYIQNDDVGSALSVLNKGLDLSPDYFPFIKLKAQIFVGENMLDEAISLLTDNMPAIDENPDYYALLASVYNKQKKYMVAADIYHQLTEINSQNGEWWFGMGASLNLAGKTVEAKSAYAKALQVGGLKPEVRAYLESQLNE